MPDWLMSKEQFPETKHQLHQGFLLYAPYFQYFILFYSRHEYRKIFVGGLAPEVEEKDLLDYFGKFGTIKVNKYTNMKNSTLLTCTISGFSSNDRS